VDEREKEILTQCVCFCVYECLCTYICLIEGLCIFATDATATVCRYLHIT